MSIEQLKAKREKLLKDRQVIEKTIEQLNANMQQMMANLNATIGGIQVVEQLMTEAEGKGANNGELITPSDSPPVPPKQEPVEVANAAERGDKQNS